MCVETCNECSCSSSDCKRHAEINELVLEDDDEEEVEVEGVFL